MARGLTWLLLGLCVEIWGFYRLWTSRNHPTWGSVWEGAFYFVCALGLFIAGVKTI